MSTTSSVLPDNATVEQVFKTLDTETTALFEQLDLSFLTDYPVFAPDPRGRTRVHEPPELLKGVIHCFYSDIYGPRPMARELHNEDVWRQCGFESPPSRRTLSRFIADFELVAEDVFIELVHELAEQVPLGKLFRIDGTDIPVDHRDEDAEWNYDHTEDDYYYGYGCCVVTAANNIPVAAAFTPAKKVDQETAMRVTRDALAVETPRWMIGDSEFDMLEWHDHLLAQAVVPIAPYNPRNTNDPLDIGYRVEERIKEHSDTVHLWQKQLEETYSYRSQVETAIGVCKDLGLGTPRVRGRVKVKAHVFLALCLRLAVALANHHRGNDVASPTITL
ncbi:transposase [Halomicroarcula sp. GCM10025324]|uniref:IS4/IS5 family transposase n=1 Tax=Halosegnis longus TaxID=2216012 RepID=A0AAJ4R5F1_9EURY|nr:IS4/IS5 family transposase [Salella cibi]